MKSYPCEHLSQLEALCLWRLAEENYAEIRAASSRTIKDLADPAPSTLSRALDLLSPEAYRDVVALVWLGRGDHDSYILARQRANSELYTDYIASKGLLLHAYLRRVLETCGLASLHEIVESRYPLRREWVDEEAE